MEKTELTKKEEDEIKELTESLSGSLWQDGLFDSPTISETRKLEFFDLGEQILTEEGFLLFYQGQDISAKLQLLVDAQARQWIYDTKNKKLDTPFMPLTTITEIEYNYILDWMKEKTGSDVFKNGITY